MSVPSHQTAQGLPPDLIAAMESGDLTEQQLREVVRIEAAQLGLSMDEAIAHARQNRLPQTPSGFDLQFHILMLLA